MSCSREYIWYAAALLMACTPKPPAEGERYPFVSVEHALEHHEAHPDSIVFIDTRSRAAYAAGHIPGAVHLRREQLRDREAPFAGKAPQPDSLAALLARLGIHTGHWMLLYDDGPGVEASRLYWLLKAYGHCEVNIVPHALAHWPQPLSIDVPHESATPFHFAGPKSGQLITAPELSGMLLRGHAKVLDVRSEAEYSGAELKSGAEAAGHIPGATPLCYLNNFYTTPDGLMRLKPTSSLRTLYSQLVQPDDTVVVYCHSGVRSSITSIVLSELLGYRHVYNFEGSWCEWSYYALAENNPQLIER